MFLKKSFLIYNNLLFLIIFFGEKSFSKESKLFYIININYYLIKLVNKFLVIIKISKL